MFEALRARLALSWICRPRLHPIWRGVDFIDGQGRWVLTVRWASCWKGFGCRPYNRPRGWRVVLGQLEVRWSGADA